MTHVYRGAGWLRHVVDILQTQPAEPTRADKAAVGLLALVVVAALLFAGNGS